MVFSGLGFRFRQESEANDPFGNRPWRTAPQGRAQRVELKRGKSVKRSGTERQVNEVND